MIYLLFIYPVVLLLLNPYLWIGVIIWIISNYIVFGGSVFSIMRYFFMIIPLLMIYFISAYLNKIPIDWFFILRFIFLAQIGGVLSLWIQKGIGMENEVVDMVRIYLFDAAKRIKLLSVYFREKDFSLSEKLKYSIEYFTWSMHRDSTILSVLPYCYNKEVAFNTKIIWGITILLTILSIMEFLWLMF